MAIMANSLPTEGKGIRLILGEPVQKDFFYVYHGNIIHSEGGAQTLYVMEHPFWGRILFLNGTLQFTTRDEFIYHEALVHIPVQAREEGKIKRVLICGGGDFGAARELLKYPDIEEIIIADIDPHVPEIVKEYFPELMPGEDPRLKLLITDAYKLVEDYVKEKKHFDLVIIDSTDPDISPEGKTIELSHSLFSQEFHELLKALAPEGLIVQQAATPFTMKNVLAWTYETFVKVYGQDEVYCYRADIPSFGGDNAYILRAQGETPIEPRRPALEDTKYYTHEVHRASFSIPKFWQEVLK
ncbi:Spermine synthase [Thermodesulfatator indicus DSM 15286]|uniref:Polyamine aminopropyltransferase n=1 Tax=Thermodesulfatator indicus (strain DSM 15286 / JCM 11887 / CIR29812) TaxID=667014 RepID=F8A8S8_THEID|nr:spermine synthase [Thermodesulfatator indicus]AEH45035.1 Spermine synthase [Thermodesulfatator indicus DSM 15286]